MSSSDGGPFLAQCHGLISTNAERLAHLGDLPMATANTRPDTGGWSIAQCLDHAFLTAELYLPYMERALARSRPRGSRPITGRGTMVGRWLLEALDPDRPQPKVLRAPGLFAPAESAIGWPDLLERGRGLHDRLRAMIERGRDRDLDRARHRTPISWLLRVSLAQALRLHAIHIARHLDQADRVRASVAALA